MNHCIVVSSSADALERAKLGTFDGRPITFDSGNTYNFVGAKISTLAGVEL